MSRGIDSPLVVWDEFVEAFLGHLLPPEMRRSRVDKFLHLRQNGRSIQDYSLEFDSLAIYAPVVIVDMTDRMHQYVMWLDRYLVDSCMVMASHQKMDISWLQAYAQGMEDQYRGHQPDRDYDRGHHKTASSLVGDTIIPGIQELVRAPRLQLHRCLGLRVSRGHLCLSALGVIKYHQYEDPTLVHHRDEALQKEETPFEIAPDGVLWYKGLIKMYHNHRCLYWLDGMKKDIAEFVAQCLNCQQVKVEHQKPTGLLQEMEVPIWKWEVINMDFITSLSRTLQKYESVWVIVDKLTKSSHFLSVRTTYSDKDYDRLYVKEIVRLHGVPTTIISNRGA
ncbi:uncharacterized protein LOC129894742 [Solanum dulcamara]|uniref:uncharacterized protein LOC129894742 n=1 Tax=Solanum dulcamara TaxID=45834 RepID=UPI002484FF13|nr:uncharacterized protein LOC129894742 [Solanum dulcamara]